MSEKRPAEEEISAPQRYTRIKLASPSPENTESDTESIHSFQGNETELVKDTSDTSFSSSPAHNVEYEITDIEKQTGRFYFSDETDDSAEILDLDTISNTKTNDSIDIAVLGDTSQENSTSPTSNSDVDPGLPRNDYLDFEKCVLCSTNNKDISYPYCSTCFKWKKNFFISRPKRRQKSLKKSQTLNLSRKSDSEIFPNKNCQIGEKSDDCVDSSLSKELSEDSGACSAEPQMSEDVVDGPSQEPSTSGFTSPGLSSRRMILDTCRVCFLKPENGLFVHWKMAHVYGCYDCAKKIWYHSGCCPICRKKIFKVSRLYV